MSTRLHDLHISSETRPGPSSFFDHWLWVAIAVLAGIGIGFAVMMWTDVEPRVTQPAPEGVDVLVRPE